MNNCVDCSCEQVTPGYEACGGLHELNDSKVSGSAKVFSYAQLCDYPKLLPKAFYGIWCTLKNAIAQVCWLTAQLKALSDKVKELEALKDALGKILQNLKDSGAWEQTGPTIFDGQFKPDRNIATGNINVFGGTTDGNSFIRTNNGSTENDLAGGI